MSAISQSADRSDVNDGSYTSKRITISTSAVELFTGSSRNPNRQLITIYNDSSGIIYIGPSGVTTSGATKGYQIEKKQTVTMAMGDVAIYAIAASAVGDITVQELA